MCLFILFFCLVPEIPLHPALLSQASLKPVNFIQPFYVFPFDLMYKINGKTAISQSIFSML